VQIDHFCTVQIILTSFDLCPSIAPWETPEQIDFSAIESGMLDTFPLFFRRAAELVAGLVPR